MKLSSRILAVVMALVFCFALLVPVVSAEGEKDFVITNPYAGINWGTVNQYKAALHTHTNASDGDVTLKQSIERHVDCDFDIVATTDHSTVNTSWESENFNNLVHKGLDIFANLKSLIQKDESIVVKALEYLGTEGTFANGKSYVLAKNEAGDDILTVDGAKQVLRVPFGNEQNGLSAQAHVNSWFVDYTNTFPLASYNMAVRNIDSNNGLCVINHPGRYSNAYAELNSKAAYNEEDFAYWYFNNKLASLISAYDACIGIDVNSKGDDTTRFDRVLWDTLLKKFAAAGENVYGIASSDAHALNIIDTGSTVALMPELSSAALKTALKNGQFFAASTCIGNPQELEEIATALKEYYGETDIYSAVNNVATALIKRAAKVESGEFGADVTLKAVYSTLDDNGFNKAATKPVITAVTSDDELDTITVNTENALIVRWISDGKLIATTKADEGTAVLNLADYADVLGDYVRAEVFGEGGILYTQPLLLNAAENAASGALIVDRNFIDLGSFDFLFPIIGKWYDIFVRLPKSLGIGK